MALPVVLTSHIRTSHDPQPVSVHLTVVAYKGALLYADHYRMDSTPHVKHSVTGHLRPTVPLQLECSDATKTKYSTLVYACNGSVVT